MEKQNFNNHVRMHPAYHYVGSVLVLFVLIGSIAHVVRTVMNDGDVFLAVLQLATGLLVILAFSLTRLYSMKVQDRVIRAEENFRCYRLTGNVLPETLTMSQITALRFASDDEFPQLVERAVNETLKSKDIKQSVKEWRGDYWRV